MGKLGSHIFEIKIFKNINNNNDKHINEQKSLLQFLAIVHRIYLIK